MKVSSSNCWSVDVYNPAPYNFSFTSFPRGVNANVPSSNNYNGGFACELMLKDLGIAKETAEKVHHSTPLGHRTWEIYSKLTKEGMNRKDFSIVYQQLYDNKI
jgi:3-hydroxyisobutyrate dehydrogenase